MRISGYIPAYNSAATIKEVIRRLKEQTVPLSEILVVDDGSKDATSAIAEREGARVIKLDRNRGRGFCRAVATEESTGDYILACDSTCGLEPEFTALASAWLVEAQVAAAYGWLWDPAPKRAADHWRNRHLFCARPRSPAKTESFITTGSLTKRAACLEVGNYDRNLSHSEDAELGRRLIQAGYSIISDPKLTLTPLTSNSAAKVVERYLRWNLGPTSPHSLQSKLKFAHYALKTLLPRDFRAKDPGGALITLQCIFRSIYF